MVRVRFAPSPTGYLHIGNMRTALFNYLFAKRNGGQFILRVEDTDLERSKREYEEAQKEDLRWMGVHWDEGPDSGGPYGPYRQSERLNLYREHVEKLIRDGKAYYCYVTEEETEEMKRTAKLERRPPRFDNRGRDFSREEIEKRKAAGVKPTVRFRIENPRLVLNDLIRGEVSFNLDDMVGDFVIQRADGSPTFHLAVCIDDALMKVTHVIRGEDHLSNTPKHILLFEAMGYKPPQYGHLSLVHGPGGEPLSKRLASLSIREFRRRGYLPEAVANYIVLLGWAPGGEREIVGWEELQKIFDLGRVSRSSSNFDDQKMDWVNGEHIRLLGDADFCRVSLDYLKAQGGIAAGEEKIRSLLPVFKDNIVKLEDLPERLGILEENFSYEQPALVSAEESRQIFQEAIGVLKGLDKTGDEMYPEFLERLKQRVKARGKALMLPVRMALTGKEHGPEIKRFFPLLGTSTLVGRFERALQQR